MNVLSRAVARVNTKVGLDLLDLSLKLNLFGFESIFGVFGIPLLYLKLLLNF
jgi:hypothetical protein